jgi:transcriptional regulator with XRE-family HTH domain
MSHAEFLKEGAEMSRSEYAAVVRRVVAGLRALRGWSQAELAAAAGVAESTVSRCESGVQVPTRRTFERLVAALDPPPKLLEDILAWLRESVSGSGGSVRLAEPARLPPAAAELAAAMTRLEKVAIPSESTKREAAPLFTPSEWGRREALDLWSLLEPLSSEDQLFLVVEASEYHRWELCELLCELSLKAAADQAERALELASLALNIVENVKGETRCVQRLQGAVLGHFANALRVAGDPPAAAEKFPHACRLWKSGTGGTSDFVSEARLLSLEASLCIDQRRPKEALEMIRHALRSASQGEKKKLLLQRADALSLSGSLEGAIVALREATSFISRAAEPRLYFVLQFNLANNLLQAGRLEEAEELFPDLRELAAQLGNDLDSLRLRWLEGRLAASLGRREAAIAALQAVRQGFADRKIAYDTALASLELAAL